MDYQKAGSMLQKVLEDNGFLNVKVHSTTTGTRIEYAFPYMREMEREKPEIGYEFSDKKLAIGVGRIFGVALSKLGAPELYRVTVKGSSFDGEGEASFTVGSCKIWGNDKYILTSCVKVLLKIEESVFRGML